MKIAIVTGASSGLGTEYVRVIAEKYTDVEEIWVVARRADRLNALKEKYGEKKIFPISLDLTKDESYKMLSEMLASEQPEIKILVNNAGYGTLGDFDTMETSSQTGMIDLNNKALTAVTSVALPYMKKGSFAVNVCSIASFAPNPRMTVYCSTKAYVLSFSKSLRFELKKKGINVLALCPGPMDTEFLPAAGIEKGASHTFDTLPRVNPAAAAERSLHHASRGRGIYTPRAFFKFYRFLAKILPHGIVMHMSKT
jgi:short-subunit dehydrogenase